MVEFLRGADPVFQITEKRGFVSYAHEA